MSPLAYSLVFVFPLLSGVAFVLGGWWTAAVPLLVFGVIPLLELVLPASTANVAREARARPVFDWLLYAIAALQVGLLVFFLVRVPALSGWELAGATLTMGICCGAFGIDVAHELGHRTRRHERLMAGALLLTSLYVHFTIEHNRGHHARGATDGDPASARRGEWLYAFWVRSVTRGWLGAWQIENARLARKGLPWWSPRNEMLRLQVVQGLSLALVLALSPWAALAWLGAATVGFLLLETVNYVEHYGLRRAETAPGRFERVRPEHSWNSDHPIGRALLFELSRHSDHHAWPARPYPELRHFDASPQLPTGYPGMILLALVPPLWFRVMDAQVAAERERIAALPAPG